MAGTVLDKGDISNWTWPVPLRNSHRHVNRWLGFQCGNCYSRGLIRVAGELGRGAVNSSWGRGI